MTFFRHSRQLSTRRLRLDVQLAYYEYQEHRLRWNVVWFVCVREKLTIPTTTITTTATAMLAATNAAQKFCFRSQSLLSPCVF